VAETDPLLAELHNGILSLTLNRPRARNAINWELRRALLAELTGRATSPDVRVVVIRGAGGSFCAGGDIKQMGAGMADSLAKLDMAGTIVLAMANLDKPVVGAIQGDAAGAGMSFALACDLVVADTTARFHPSFVHRGLAPDMSGSFWLTRQVGIHRAKDILLSGRTISCDEAADLGLVSQVWSPEDFDVELNAYLTRLANGPTSAYGEIKRLVNGSYESSLAEQLTRETLAQLALSGSADHLSRIAAFTGADPA
jgi:2-(1,2-epoxy-1,2-dihydrophenyl)acetyl-CoA isomerase